MKEQNFIDSFCQRLKVKYLGTDLSVEGVGCEYPKVLTNEALLGQRLLGEKFVEVYFPYPELRGFHHQCHSGRLTIGYEWSDTHREQLRTKLHELAEYVLNRLALVWPGYGRILSYLQGVEGDRVADRFADSVIAELIPRHGDITQRMLRMHLGFMLINLALGLSLQLSELAALGSSRHVYRETVEMPARMDSMLVGFYQHLTDYILLQERENSLSSEQMQVESCQAIFNGQRSI